MGLAARVSAEPTGRLPEDRASEKWGAGVAHRNHKVDGPKEKRTTPTLPLPEGAGKGQVPLPG